MITLLFGFSAKDGDLCPRIVLKYTISVEEMVTNESFVYLLESIPKNGVLSTAINELQRRAGLLISEPICPTRILNWKGKNGIILLFEENNEEGHLDLYETKPSLANVVEVMETIKDYNVSRYSGRPGQQDTCNISIAIHLGR